MKKIVDVAATMAMLMEETPQSEGESAREYASRILHLTYLCMEHGELFKANQH
jgi:hypothetical protein